MLVQIMWVFAMATTFANLGVCMVAVSITSVHPPIKWMKNRDGK